MQSRKRKGKKGEAGADQISRNMSSSAGDIILLNLAEKFKVLEPELSRPKAIVAVATRKLTSNAPRGQPLRLHLRITRKSSPVMPPGVNRLRVT